MGNIYLIYGFDGGVIQGDFWVFEVCYVIIC